MVVAGIVAGVASAGAAAYGANKSSKSMDKATKRAGKAADRQMDVAEEQWAYNRDVYLPHAMDVADESLLMQTRIADFQIAEAQKNRAMADEMFGQAKKSWKYQDEYMSMVDDYMSGNRGNTMADEANADVEQAYSQSLGAMQRNAARYGINPGSAGFQTAMGDLYSNKTLAAAGAQTAARRLARDKAEQMVGIAAGAGQAGFGTGLGAAGLATGNYNGASGAASAGLNGVNSVATTFNNGASAAGAGFGSASRNYMGSYGGLDPLAAFGSGALNSVIKVGAANNWFSNPTSGSPSFYGVGGDGGFSGTFDAYANGIIPD